jgi:hypothetical protein
MPPGQSFAMGQDSMMFDEEEEEEEEEEESDGSIISANVAHY